MRFRFVIPALDLQMDEHVCNVPASYVPEIGTMIEITYHTSNMTGGERKHMRCIVADYDLALIFGQDGSEYLAIYTLVPVETP